MSTVIFDMDGILIDSEFVYQQVNQGIPFLQLYLTGRTGMNLFYLSTPEEDIFDKTPSS